MDYVWYASYGSNISTKRFLCYIRGGRAHGAMTSEEGCRDKALPLKYENISIARAQYFAKASYRWQNKGVAFIDGNYSDEKTLGRMYLITSSQFEDVVKQENKMSVASTLDLKLQEAESKGSAIVIPDSWYGRILFLGKKDGYPIYTFTSPRDYDQETLNPPSEQYLSMIASGLIENYQMDIEDLTTYFMHKKGVELGYVRDELFEILTKHVF